MIKGATFPCPWCGASLSQRTPGTVFPCPFCKAMVTAPQEPVAHSDVAPSSEPFGPRSAIETVVPASIAAWYSVGPSRLAIGRHPSTGFLVLGPAGEPPRLRALDLASRRVAWESLEGEPAVSPSAARTLAVRGPAAYVASERSLLALDLATGHTKWSAQLPEPLHSRGAHGLESGPAILDALPQAPRGAVVARAGKSLLLAFERDTGQLLWSRRIPTHALQQLDPVPDSGVVIARYWQGTDGKLEIIDPWQPHAVASPGFEGDTDFQRVDVVGRFLVCKVEGWGADEEDGLLVLDAASAQTLVFEKERAVDDQVRPTIGSNRVYCAASSGDLIFAAPHAAHVPCPVPGFKVAALCAAGPALFVLVAAADPASGALRRRLVALDAQRLVMRDDYGELGPKPDDAWDTQLVTNGQVVVAVRSPSGDPAQCEVRAIDAVTGRVVWARYVGTWLAHGFVGECYVSQSRERIDVVNPSTGETVVSFPF